MSYVGCPDSTMGFSLKPPRWLRKSQPLKILKKAAILNLKAGAVVAAAIAAPHLVPLIASKGLPFLARGAKAAFAVGKGFGRGLFKAPSIGLPQLPAALQPVSGGFSLPMAGSLTTSSSEPPPSNGAGPVAEAAPGGLPIVPIAIVGGLLLLMMSRRK